MHDSQHSILLALYSHLWRHLWPSLGLDGSDLRKPCSRPGSNGLEQASVRSSWRWFDLGIKPALPPVRLRNNPAQPHLSGAQRSFPELTIIGECVLPT